MTPSFISQFEACTLTEFHHKDHIRVAWTYLLAHPLPEAMIKMRDGIKKFAKHHGKDTLYHETITFAYVLMIHDRLARHYSSSNDCWESFVSQNADLFAWKPSILDQYYPANLVTDELAKKQFLWPSMSPSR